MSISIPTDSKKFRRAFLPGYLFIIIVMTLLSHCYDLIEGRLCFDETLAISIASILILALVPAWMHSFWYSIVLSTEGVCVYQCGRWGHFVRWQDMAEVRPFRVLDERWLRIHTVTGQKAVELPLFVSHKAEFIQEVKRLAPPGSQLLNYLS